MAGFIQDAIARARSPRRPNYATSPDMAAQPGTADSPDYGDPVTDQADLSPDVAGGVGPAPFDDNPGDPSVTKKPADQSGVGIGPDGEWQPGVGELGPPAEPGGGGGDIVAATPPASGQTGGGLLGGQGELDQFKAALSGLISGQGASADSPFLKGAITAHRNANSRGFDRARAIAAERAAVEGTNNSGSFDTNLLGLAQDYGNEQADYEGNLVANANDANEQRRLASLGLFGNLYNQQAGLGLNQAQFEASQNQQALLALLQLLQAQGQGAF